MEKMLVVYKITFMEIDKCYIGITNNFERRKKKHLQNAKSNVSGDLYDAIRKYNNPIFEIIKVCNTLEELFESEKKYILEYNSYDNGFNRTLGGQGSFGSTRPKSEKWKKNHSIKMMGKHNPRFGLSLDNDFKENLSSIMKEYYKNNPQKKAWGNKSCSGLIWITNGKTFKKIKKDAPIPEGYVKGRKYKGC